MSRLFLSLFLLLLSGSLLYRLATDLLFEADLQAFDDAVLLQNAHAPLNLTLQRLAQTPEDQWLEQVAAMAPYFSADLRLLTLDDLNFSPEDQHQLAQTPIFVLDGPEGAVAYAQAPGTGQVLVYGPQPEPKGMALLDDRLQMGWVTLMAVLMLAWVLWLYGRLNRIKTSLQAIRQGNFNARIESLNGGLIGDLGQTFNQMAARIEALLREKTQLIAAVSHEMRTPLSRLAFSQHFLEEQLNTDGEAATLLQEMKDDLAHLEGLIADLLTYSRLSFQLTDAQRTNQDLGPWLQELVQRRQPSSHQDLELRLENHTESIKLKMVPALMETACNNLISNGLRHCRKRVILRLQKKADRVWLHIDDDGMGISQEDRIRVLEPFVRLDAARSRDAGGWGLGTALVQQIVVWHGGRLTVAESPEGGARFSIDLPLNTKAGYGAFPGGTSINT